MGRIKWFIAKMLVGVIYLLVRKFYAKTPYISVWTFKDFQLGMGRPPEGFEVGMIKKLKVTSERVMCGPCRVDAIMAPDKQSAMCPKCERVFKCGIEKWEVVK